MQHEEADGASEDDAAGTLTEGEQYEELYEATGDEGVDGYTDEDMQEQLQEESADQEATGAEGDDDDAEEAQAASDYPVSQLTTLLMLLSRAACHDTVACVCVACISSWCETDPLHTQCVLGNEQCAQTAIDHSAAACQAAINQQRMQ